MTVTLTRNVSRQGSDGIALLPALPDADEVFATLREPLNRRVITPALSVNENLPIIGVGAIPSGPSVQRTAEGTWFMAASYGNDPSLIQDGAIAIPEHQLKRLQMLRAAGVSVDEIWMAHELPGTWAPGNPLPTIVPDAVRYRQLDKHLESGIRTAFNALRSVLAATAASGIAFTTRVVETLETRPLDPVVLGGIRHSDRRIAAWVILARWDW